jgi:hypothetical protein
MRRPAALFPIALALGAISLAPAAGAREQGPTEIEKCQTIRQSGSYRLVNNLTATGDCLVIDADFVTVDLAGFTISGTGGRGISSTPPLVHHQGIAVRNGSISGLEGVILDATASIVEGVRVFGSGSLIGILANGGIVKGNVVLNTSEGFFVGEGRR